MLMRAKKLITLALPIMLLGGCATDKAEKKDYKMQMAYQMKNISEESKVINDILTSQKPVEEKAKEFKEKSKPLLETAEKVKKLEPGEKYKDVQSLLNESMDLVKESVSQTQDGLDKQDRVLLNQGLQTMSNSSKRIVEAHKKLKEMGEAN